MSALSRTQGPWNVGGNIARGLIVVGSEKGPVAVAEARDEEEVEGNARLIAAAPEMLSALHLVGMSGGWHYLSFETRDILNSVIAKAEGRS